VSIRWLSILQWAGLLLGGGMWAAQLVTGFGVTVVTCGPASQAVGVTNDPWQLGIGILAAAGILAAGAAAVIVVVRTRGVSYDADGPPLGRIRFLAIAALAANAIFLTGMLLAELASIVDTACRQA
jgi:hypothetical protein